MNPLMMMQFLQVGMHLAGQGLDLIESAKEMNRIRAIEDDQARALELQKLVEAARSDLEDKIKAAREA